MSQICKEDVLINKKIINEDIKDSEGCDKVVNEIIIKDSNESEAFKESKEPKECEESEECDDTDDEDYDPEKDSAEYSDTGSSSELKDDEDSDNFFNKHDEENDKSRKNNIMFVINNNDSSLSNLFSNIKKRKRKNNSTYVNKNNKKSKYIDMIKKYTDDENAYFDGLSENEKDILFENEKKLENAYHNIAEPLRFKFLKLNIPTMTKNIIISKLEQVNKMEGSSHSDEFFKLSNWINTLSKIPLGVYHALPSITNGSSEFNERNDIAIYLQNIKKTIDDNIFGHEETKEQIVRILAQWISNPSSNGYVIGIQGSPGVGKTKLVKEGICKAMNFPFAFVSLGGVSDSSFLNGHNYTYEGSTYGKITEALIKARVMNPVFLFDELDKVSNTAKGDEIINTLIHITDPVQNDRYNDKYFEEIDLDLSKSLVIFTYNDESMINPILKDRMITIKVNGYNANEKLTLCRDYLIPELLPQYNIKKGDIVFEEGLLTEIIEEDGKDDGVRNIKRIINNTISWINMMRYIPTDNIKITFPFTVDTVFYNKYCKKKNTDMNYYNKYILNSMYL